VIAAPAALGPVLAVAAVATPSAPEPPPTPPPVKPRVIGCRPVAPNLRMAGPRRHRVVALTFDDGPGAYTPSVLGILEREEVRATFFLIGQQVQGNEGLLRRALRDGDALGNHTWSHANVSGGGFRQMSGTQRAITRATGYTPCVFRAPYGAWSGLLVGQARDLGLNSVGWSVDPTDWSRPGAGAIYSRVVGATRPGAIVLMHDGGGPRSQTVSALPKIIATLRGRGYRFVTVPELLGLPARYAPRPRRPLPIPPATEPSPPTSTVP
jgi:peptidoglycan/xylan/chitin deacetylase (PgdA/CDA1 family)